MYVYPYFFLYYLFQTCNIKHCMIEQNMINKTTKLIHHTQDNKSS